MRISKGRLKRVVAIAHRLLHLRPDRCSRTIGSARDQHADSRWAAIRYASLSLAKGIHAIVEF
jgi:hypothetical protein